MCCTKSLEVLYFKVVPRATEGICQGYLPGTNLIFRSNTLHSNFTQRLISLPSLILVYLTFSYLTYVSSLPPVPASHIMGEHCLVCQMQQCISKLKQAWLKFCISLVVYVYFITFTSVLCFKPVQATMYLSISHCRLKLECARIAFD